MTCIIPASLFNEYGASPVYEPDVPICRLVRGGEVYSIRSLGSLTKPCSDEVVITQLRTAISIATMRRHAAHGRLTRAIRLLYRLQGHT